jgi:4-hydroxybenzoate polyprenyltransferase
MDSSHTSKNGPRLGVADATPGNWVERLVPGAALPYAQLMRLDRPIGWWLLLIPCWWGLALAVIAHGPAREYFRYAALFLAGAIVMRGAGCVINDLMDRKIDAQVARTRARPLPSGRVSPRQALVFLAVLLAIGLAILLQFNRATVFLGLFSVTVIAVYPLMKRVTYWPQLVLGLAFNWGALLGWTAVTERLQWPAVVLYAAGIFWTLAYDTIYAHPHWREINRAQIWQEHAPLARRFFCRELGLAGPGRLARWRRYSRLPGACGRELSSPVAMPEF